MNFQVSGDFEAVLSVGFPMGRLEGDTGVFFSMEEVVFIQMVVALRVMGIDTSGIDCAFGVIVGWV